LIEKPVANTALTCRKHLSRTRAATRQRRYAIRVTQRKERDGSGREEEKREVRRTEGGERRERERGKVCACVCVCERERESDRERDSVSVCVCECVCVRERERKRAREKTEFAHLWANDFEACVIKHKRTYSYQNLCISTIS